MDRIQPNVRILIRQIGGMILFAGVAVGQTPEFSKIFVEHDPGWDIVRIILPTQHAPRSEKTEYLHDPPRVRVTFDGRLDDLATGTRSCQDPFLKSVQVAAPSKGKVSITAHLAASFPQDVKARFHSSGTQRFYHIDIPRPARYRQQRWTPLTLERAKKRGLPVVVVDAGHGGYDPGATARSRKSLEEKQISLDIALEVDRLLRKNDRVFPVLTREGDYYPTLEERVDLVRRTGADLLVSIHADSSPRSSAKGFQIWVIDRSRRDVSNEARRLLKYGLRKQLDGKSLSQQNLVLERQERFVIDETDRAAQLMEASLARLPDVENRGVTVHPKSLRVLKHNFAPAFLVETGFLSNSVDARRLASSTKRREMAAAIALGIESYFTQFKRRRATAPLSPRLEIAESPEEPTPRTFDGKAFEYTVKRGDTLVGLAKRFKVEKEAILIASNLPLSRRILYVSEKIKIPASRGEEVSILPAKPNAASPRVVPQSLEIGPTTLGLDRPSVTEYVVRSDDNLFKIAHRHGTTPSDLLKLNKWSDGHPLKIGDRMMVPDLGNDPAKRVIEGLGRVWSKDSSPEQYTPPAAANASASLEPEWCDYTVRSGDNLSSIAQKHSTTPEVIRRKNGLKRDLIRKGQTLKVPCGMAQGLEHEVEQGDTLEKIAVTYGVPVDDLRRLNDLNSDRILAGDLLRVR